MVCVALVRPRVGRPDNTSPHPVYDVVLRANGHVLEARAIPAGATAGFVLEEHPDADVASLLRARWVDTAAPAPPAAPQWDRADCVMMRDPAVPVEVASGHRLYEAEVDVLLDTWGERLGAPRPTLIYRESDAALAEAMPISVYTDMFHYIELRRLGVVVVEGVALP